MKYRLLLSIVQSFICFSSIVSFSQTEFKRQEIDFNSDWKFELSDSIKYNQPNFKDSAWSLITVPHDWSASFKPSEKYSGRNAWLPGGIGWYRKTFFVPKNHTKKHIEIQFDGVYRNSKIWINGNYVGAQYDGFTSFYFDVSDYLDFGKNNTIAIRVDNSVQPNCRWYTGSGIYRNTRMIVTAPLYVETGGTFVTTPKIDKSSASVFVETTLKNDLGVVKGKLVTEVYNNKGELVATQSSNFNEQLRKPFTIQQKLTVVKPNLWSVDTPTLYTSVSKVYQNSNIVDVYKTKFGIRSIRLDAKKGFYLNEQNIKLKGVCLHNDAGSLGVAVPVEVWQRRLSILKSIGCNAIRTAHNITAPEFMDLCDEMGFLVMDEFVDKWSGDGIPKKKRKSTFFNPLGFANPYFELEWEKNYRESIKRDRNHPSVVFWSVGNENHSPGTIQQNAGLRKYTSFVRSIDDTRPVVSGMERGRDGDVTEKVSNILESCSLMDAVALNYGEQWCTLIGNANPGKPYVSTESYIYFNSTPEKRFANIEKSPWLDVMENPHNMGLFLWSGINYLGESRKWPKLGSNSGLIDFAGYRNPAADFYQSVWAKKPMVKIYVYKTNADDFSTSGRWGWPPMDATWNLEQGKKYDLTTYTNCESVDLYINNRKIGRKYLKEAENRILKWRQIPYEPGVVKAVGIIGGKEVCEFELKTNGDPRKINVHQQQKKLAKGEVTHLEVFITDKNGNRVTDKEMVLNFEIGNNGEILALENGDVLDADGFGNKKAIKTKNGKCLVVLKAVEKSGDFFIKIHGLGLKNKRVKYSIQ